VIVAASLNKGKETLNHDKEDDTQREDVSFCAGVDSALFDFGSHVSLRAPVRSEAFDVLVLSKAKVSDFDVEILIK